MESTSAPERLHRPPLQADLLVRALTRHRSRPALWDDGDTWTAGRLADEISRYVQAWRAWGINEGGAVAILSANRPEVLIAMGAALIAGVRWVPLHPLGSLQDQLFILEDAGVETLLFDPASHRDRAAELSARAASLRRVVALAPTSEATDMATAASRFGARRLIAPSPDPSGIAWILYTGGTTGRPKGVLETHRGVAAMTHIQMAEWDWPADLRTLCVTPLSHAASALFLPTLVRGGSLAVLPSFDPDRFVDTVERLRITATLLVPTMIYRLLDHPGLDGPRLGSLRTLFYGASAISPTRLAEAIERFGPIFFQFYGQAEAPTTVTVLGKNEHSADRLASCGRPVSWLDVALLDDDGNEVQPGEPGELCVRGPLVMAGYHGQPEQTAAALRGGRLHTGDIATADDQGYLTIVDRTKDMIVTGGFNVFPREVEDVLATHPGVSQVAVVGVPDPNWGEAVRALVVPRPDVTLDSAELIRLVKEHKGPAAAPKHIEFVRAIPLTPLGKPDKKALRATYWAAHDRSVS
ncbi:AMP-binding protein [Actinomadura fibrosa]|uniref:AMP-binding protein n=1 Tax=Actinomadura fibrosa TaxID=111802 RepID=A0ABW2XMC4_9ACTN|nr:AMP-binding protein [Actinomadura fibrosa]